MTTTFVLPSAEIEEEVATLPGLDGLEVGVGVHLRPRGEEHDMGDSDPKAILDATQTDLQTVIV